MSAAQGRKLLLETALRADVLLTDRSLQELKVLGLDCPTLEGPHPDLVYARVSGFGPLGPDNELPLIDELAAARTGMMPILPQPGEPPGSYRGWCYACPARCYWVLGL